MEVVLKSNEELSGNIVHIKCCRSVGECEKKGQAQIFTQAV